MNKGLRDGEGDSYFKMEHLNIVRIGKMEKEMEKEFHIMKMEKLNIMGQDIME